MLSMTSDYVCSSGCPRAYLEGIAEAGFSHVHWCHEWASDHVYTDDEVRQIGQWLRDCGLSLTDLHASAGERSCWAAPAEDERLAGVELVKNRIEMASRLGGDVVIMHLPDRADPPDGSGPAWQAVLRSLDALEPFAAKRGLRIALENGDFDAIEEVFSLHGRDYIGLCYDSGHGNLRPDGLDRLERLKGRLISVHLHDNDGTSDQHRLPFTGTVDWRRLAGIIAGSSYAKWPNIEAVMRNSPIRDEKAWLAAALAAGRRLADMIAAAGQGTSRRVR